MKKFFSIEESYKVEWMDVTAFITIVNVVLLIAGMRWAPLLGILNASLGFFQARPRINTYLMNTALIILNIYFLNLQLTTLKKYGNIIIELRKRGNKT